MDIRPECVPCLLKRVLYQSKLADNGSEFDSLSAALEVFDKEFKEGKNSAEVATLVHTGAYAAMRVRDPYLELKVRADAVAETLLDKAQDYVDSSEDRLRAAITVALSGNIMDFGQGTSIEHPDMFEEIFDELLAQGIGSDDTDKLMNHLERSGDIIYIFDNSGESQLDKILIRELRRMGKRVVGVVRGEPILNDVTMEDALRTGLDKELDDLIDTQAFAIGVPVMIREDLSKAIPDSSLIIAKGMANFESLNKRDLGIPIAFLLRAKCEPVADSLDVDVGVNVVRVINE